MGLEGSSSFSCEMSIIQANNVDTLRPSTSGTFFVRLILSAGKDRHVRLETREVPLKNGSVLDWNESLSLQCSGSGWSIEWLKHQSVTLELRYRNKVTGLGRVLRTRSKLLGRVEAPWKEVFESPRLGIETWAMMMPGDSSLHGSDNAPLLRIARKLSVTGGSEDLMAKKGQVNGRNYDDCCCEDCNGYIGTLDYDVFAIVAAVDAL